MFFNLTLNYSSFSIDLHLKFRSKLKPLWKIIRKNEKWEKCPTCGRRFSYNNIYRYTTTICFLFIFK